MRQRLTSFEIATLPAQLGQHHRTLGAAQECDDLRDFRNAAVLALDLVDTCRKFTLALKQRLVGSAHPGNAVALDATPAHADDVDAGEARRRIEHVAIRNDILADGRIACHHDTFTEPHMLMHGAVATEKHVVSDFTMTADHRVIGENDVVTDVAVMRDVRADHEEAAIANRRDTASAHSASIDRDALADLAVRADDEPGRFTFVVHGLRRCAERGEGIDRRAGPDGGVTRKMHMRDKLAVVAEGHVRTDHAIRADLDVRADNGTGRDTRGGIDRQHQASINIAPTSASATSSPATFASAWYHHMFLRRVFFFMWYSMISPGPTGFGNSSLTRLIEDTRNCFSRNAEEAHGS